MSDDNDDVNPVIKEEVVVLGKKEGDEACDVCKDTDAEIQDRIKKTRRSIEYEFVDLDTDKAKDILAEEKIKGNKISIPIVRKCNIHKDGKKDCTTIEGEPTKRDWVDLELDSLDTTLEDL